MVGFGMARGEALPCPFSGLETPGRGPARPLIFRVLLGKLAQGVTSQHSGRFPVALGLGHSFALLACCDWGASASLSWRDGH